MDGEGDTGNRVDPIPTRFLSTVPGSRQENSGIPFT